MNKFSKEQIKEIIQLCSSFFYEGMTFEEFGNGKKNGGPCIPKNMTCSQYLYNRMLNKGLIK